MRVRKTQLAAILVVTTLALCAVGFQAAAQSPTNTPRPPFEYMQIKINVGDLEKSMEFYSTFFGYKEVMRTPVSPSGMINVVTTKNGKDFQDGLIFVHQQGKSAPKDPGALNTILFSVRDISGLIKRLEAAGHKIVSPPTETKNYASSVTSSAVIAYTLDPDGYSVEMVEWKP